MSRYLYLPLIFLFGFIIISVLYVKQSAREDQTQFHKHASIIADDIWAMNELGAKAYLKLALESDHFQFIHVAIPGDENFLQIDSAPLSGLAKLCYKLRIIGTKELSEPILHGSEVIGQLKGNKYVRVLFPLLNILLVMIFTLVVLAFIGYQAESKNYLTEQVEERTANLKESERRFHDLVNLLPEMVFETDLNGTILYANKAASDTLGLKNANDNLDSPSCFFDFIVPGEREAAEDDFHNSLAGAPSTLLEFTVVGVNGKKLPVLIRHAAIFKNAQVCGARMIVIDVTSKNEMEEQLHRDQKMKAIGLMAGGVAHDLNNILSGVISYPEFLLLDIDEDDALKKPLEEIRSSGLEAAEVVSDLLTVARGIATTTELIDLNEIIRGYLTTPDFKNLVDSNPQVKISSQLSPEQLKIDCSPIHIRKCLMNLIHNGIEAIDGEGSVAVSSTIQIGIPSSIVDPTVGPARRKHRYETSKYAKLTVSDSGIGIGQDEVGQIFEPFYTKKVLGRSGTGLGLTIVWNTIQDHGGTVAVSSSSQGTTFELFLPIAQTQKEVVKANTQVLLPEGKGESILVVDDDPRQRDIARKLVEKLGYKVHTVASGEEAVDYITNNTAHLIILDMIMAPGQNGRVTFEQILEIRPKQKAIIASGFAEDEDVKATMALGARAFVAKPYTLPQISSAIYKTLHS